MRTLVFASMPDGATPETHIAAGPWCFSGREEQFPGWDGTDAPGLRPGRSFPLPPDPYPDAAALAEAAHAANGEALRLTRLLGPGLFRHDGHTTLSDRFHDMALGPFMLLAVHMLAERQQRVIDLVNLYGKEDLRVPLLPRPLPFSFRDCADFKQNGIHDTAFNHYVYSRIVEALAPAKWELEYTQSPPVLPTAANGQQTSLKGSVRLFLRRLLRDLPFPRYKGFRLWQALALSLAVLGNKRTAADASIDFSAYCGPPLQWLFPARELLLACLPLALRDPHAGSGKKAAAAPERPGPLRGMTAAYMEDDAYRLRLAALRERGYRLFSVQHGANYGNLRSLGSIPFEYAAHAFFTWGWQRQKGFAVNARPMPHPALCAVADRHKEQSRSLILVGAEMSGYAYRLKSRPQAGALPEYRRGKVAFLRHVQTYFDALRHDSATPGSRHPEQDALLLYRPYFSIPGGLDDEAYVCRMIPGITICKGDLTGHMLSCRLLVLDHYGTTLHMAMAANTPCIAFWDRDGWGMDETSEKAMDALRHAGLLFHSPGAAAQKAVAVWPDLARWWHSELVQTARRAWLDAYAAIRDAQGNPFSPFALTRLWFETVRKS